MITKQVEWTQTLKYWYYIVVCKRDSPPVRLPMEAEKNERHFGNNICKSIFMTEIIWLKIKIFTTLVR